MSLSELRVRIDCSLVRVLCTGLVLLCQQQQALRHMISGTLLVFRSDVIEGFAGPFYVIEPDASACEERQGFVLPWVLFDDFLGEVTRRLKLSRRQVCPGEPDLEVQVVGLRLCCTFE